MKNKIVIQVSGGVVQAVSTNIENLDCRVVDWDDINDVNFDDGEEKDFQFPIDVVQNIY